jgi:hypothetical protein
VSKGKDKSKRRARAPGASRAALAAMLARATAPGPCELVATIRFTFPGHVDELQLQQALLRAMRTHAFGLTGQCTITAIEAPAAAAAVATSPQAAPEPAAPASTAIAAPSAKSPEPFQ